MTFYDVFYQDGGRYRVSYVTMMVKFAGQALVDDIIKLARAGSLNRTPAVKIVRYMTGEVVWSKYEDLCGD